MWCTSSLWQRAKPGLKIEQLNRYTWYFLALLMCYYIIWRQFHNVRICRNFVLCLFDEIFPKLCFLSYKEYSHQFSFNPKCTQYTYNILLPDIVCTLYRLIWCTVFLHKRTWWIIFSNHLYMSSFILNYDLNYDIPHIDGMVQDCSISTANALEMLHAALTRRYDKIYIHSYCFDVLFFIWHSPILHISIRSLAVVHYTWLVLPTQ